MNQNNGILIFGLCFFLFLAWLWMCPEDLETPTATSPPVEGDNAPKQSDTRSKETEVDKWLTESDLSSLKPHMKRLGVKVLEDFLSVDVNSLLELTDGHTADSFQNSLDLVFWLKEFHIGHTYTSIRKAGYTSRLALCEISNKMSKQISHMELPSKEGHILENALKSDEFSGWCKETKSSNEWTFSGVLYYVVIVVVSVGTVASVILLIGYIIVYALAAVVAAVIVTIFASLINIIVGGIIGGIIGGITGRRVQVPPPVRPLPMPTLSFNFSDSISRLVDGVWGGILRLFGGGGRGRNHTPSTPQQQDQVTSSFSLGLYERMTGTYLDKNRCVLEWNHDDSAQVGGSSVLTINLISKNATPYIFKASDTFHCRIMSVASRTVIPHVIEPTSLVGESVIKVSFTTKISGQYKIKVDVNNSNLSGDDIFRRYIPGPVDPNKTVFLDKTAVLVVTKGVYSAMKVIPKDSFGNKADIVESAIDIEIRKSSIDGNIIVHELVVYKNDQDCYELLIKVDQEGHYVGWVKFNGNRIGPPSFTILSLLDVQMQTVEKNVRKKYINVYYEAFMADKKRKVYCYIYPRQLQVREYFMKIIPTRTYTCKVSPSTQIIFHADPETFTLDDGFQEPITLTSHHREILGATFHKYVLKNIGGSEKFQDKQSFFYTNLKEHHRKQSRSEKKVSVSRFNLLESARQATKHFSSTDWCKKFCVEFQDEEGLDWGGLSREFFELLSNHLFDASNNLFMRFDENHQSLVHPNHSSKRPASLKLKHFYFAGKVVGKCLYESAMGNSLLVKARFTRSFLAQLIGLRINYKYFESDDPDLYTTKIQYILENDVTDFDLVFAEEEFDTNGGPPSVIPLVDNGESKEVTEQNKLQYLNALAQYRFTKRVSGEIEQFIKGLNEIVPENLLSMFDENELELLMCGIGSVTYEDLKEHVIIGGTGSWFQQVLAWFWTAVSTFTQEEMAKLLQFVTGSSQLPPGGFKELNPRFTLSSSPAKGRLPTAHTCFNQLCLPEYNSYEQFNKSLMIALNEGVEGFGML